VPECFATNDREKVWPLTPCLSNEFLPILAYLIWRDEKMMQYHNITVIKYRGAQPCWLYSALGRIQRLGSACIRDIMVSKPFRTAAPSFRCCCRRSQGSRIGDRVFLSGFIACYSSLTIRITLCAWRWLAAVYLRLLHLFGCHLINFGSVRTFCFRLVSARVNCDFSQH
jgi:hypothetical protein